MAEILQRFMQNQSDNSPPIDIISSENDYKLYAELPGVLIEDIKIDVCNKFLVLEYEKKRTYRPTQRSERVFGKVSKTLILPFPVLDQGDVQASMNNGVLYIEIVRSLAGVV